MKLIHSDIWTSPTTSESGKRYFVSFIDNFTRYTFTYALTNRSEFLQQLKEFKVMAENQLDHKVKMLRFDNAGENTSNEVREFLLEMGILIDEIHPYTPQLNGVAQRANRTLIEKVRCMLHHSGLSESYWVEGLLTATHLKNISPTTAVEEGRTPYELWWGRKPSLKNLRVFGCKAYVHVPNQRRTKLESKTIEGFLIGYTSDKKYRILTKDGVRRSRDVVFDESTFPCKLRSDLSMTL